MSGYPVKRADRAQHKLEKDVVQVVERGPAANPFFSFSYSYMEISALGGRAHVKAKKARLEGGRLTSETFEGEIDRSAYDHMVGHAQQYVLGQTALFLKSLSLSLLLPFSHKQRRERD